MTDPLAALRERFRQRAVADRQAIETLWAADPRSSELRTLIHDLSGAAGTFGYPAVSEAAGAIDDRFHDGRSPDRSQIDDLLKRLNEVAG